MGLQDKFSQIFLNQKLTNQCCFQIYFERVLFTDILEALGTILTFTGSNFFII